MKKLLIIVGLILVGNLILAQTTYPDNEDGEFEDMLTPAYYYAPSGDAFRNEINLFVHFARLESFQHPLDDGTGTMPSNEIRRGFGDGLGPGGTTQHHPALDFHIGSAETSVNLYASFNGYVATYRDVSPYRDYLTITTDIEDSLGTFIGKMVAIYAHIDLNLDSLSGRLLDGDYVNQGDIVSTHLYSGTMGGPHLHFEIRYYKTAETGTEIFYGYVGPAGSTTLTEPSAGIWTYGFWNPDTAYGYANPINHFFDTTAGISSEINTTNTIKIFPNPAKDHFTINSSFPNSIKLSIIDISGRTVLERPFHDEISISTDNFGSGIYFLKLVKDKNQITKTIVIR